MHITGVSQIGFFIVSTTMFNTDVKVMLPSIPSENLKKGVFDVFSHIATVV